MNVQPAALEGAVVLGQQIGELIASKASLGPTRVAQALAKYAQKRKWRAAGLISSSFVSGWVQLGRLGWLMKFLRDVVFYRVLYNRVLDVINYDCGKLPCVSHAVD
jgi:hypothetical protein